MSSPDFLEEVGVRLASDLLQTTYQRAPHTVRETVQWAGLPIHEPRMLSLGEYQPRIGYSHPSPLAMHYLFEGEAEEAYDVSWVAETGTRIKPGDPVARCYQVSTGNVSVQTLDFHATVREHLVVRNTKVRTGDPLVRIEVPSLSLDLSIVEKIVQQSTMDLALATNAVVKGYMGSIGESGQIAKSVVAVQCRLDLYKNDMEMVTSQLVDALRGAGLSAGDTVVVSEKIISIAQGRLFPLNLLYNNDPKNGDSTRSTLLLEEVRRYVLDVTMEDLISADSLLDWPDGPTATAGVRDPNGVARQLSIRFEEDLGTKCDVVISDTDTGLDIRQPLINCITIGATPIGATGGLALYECMRVANAAEFTRGSNRSIPLVICKPHQRRALRDRIGAHRGYSGSLDARREGLIAFA